MPKNKNKFMVGVCQPTGVFCEEHKRIIGKLDEKGFCVLFSGSLISGKLIGCAAWFLKDRNYTAVVVQLKGKFEVIVTSRLSLDYFTQKFGLVISEIEEWSQRPSFDFDAKPNRSYKI